MRVDLNSDLGEGFGPWPMGDDKGMLEVVTSANVACGFHGGDPKVMLNACRLAKARGVSVGAHPGFMDLQGFGRRPIHGMTSEEIESFVAYQIGALKGIAAIADVAVTHVKAHGALSNMACEDVEMARAIARAIRRVDANLIFVVLPFSQLEHAGREQDLRMARELFADRAYEDNGLLMNRKKPGSVIHDTRAAAANVVRMVKEQAITTVGGNVLPTKVDTICIHSDTAGAVEIARLVRGTLEEAGIEIRPFASWV